MIAHMLTILRTYVQALQAKVAALESHQNARVSSVLHPETSDPNAESDLVMPQAGMPLVAAAPLQMPAPASAALDTPSGSPLLGQPVPKPLSQVMCSGPHGSSKRYLAGMAVWLENNPLLCRGQQVLLQPQCPGAAALLGPSWTAQSFRLRSWHLAHLLTPWISLCTAQQAEGLFRSTHTQQQAKLRL